MTWLRRFAAVEDPAVRLYCFPHAGASADAYRDLAARLPAVDVVAVQYPGRQDRRSEAVPGSAAETAAAVAPLLEDEPGPPLALFGHSMGALIAYETARALERRAGARPVRLFVSGQTAPRVHAARGDLPPDDGLVDEMRRLGTGEDVLSDPEVLDLLLPALRADYAVLRSYEWEPGPPLRTPLTVLAGDADPLTPVVDAQRWLPYSVLPGRVYVLPGGHFFPKHHGRSLAGIILADLGFGAVTAGS